MRLKYIIPFLLLTGAVKAQTLLTIDDAIKLAFKNNFDILLAQNESKIAKANNTPGNAGMLPTLELTGSGNFEQNDERQKLSSGTENNNNGLKYFSLGVGAELNWTLIDGGKMFVTKNKLKEIQVLGEIQFKEKVQQTLFEVITAYYDVVRQQQQLNSIQEALNYNRERLIIAEAGLKAGSLLKTDLLQARIDLNVSNENLINQKIIIENSLENLNVLLGGKIGEAFNVTDSIPLNYSLDKTTLLQKIESVNASILGFKKKIEIAHLELKENKTLYLPMLNFKAGYYYSKNNSSEGSVLSNRLACPQVGGTLAIPLYNGGETRRKVATARIQTESAQYDLEKIKLEIANELDNILTEFESQQKLLKIETENIQLARENIQISLERLKHGQTTSLEVRKAQEDFELSCSRLINFRYNLKISETKIKQMASEL